VVMRQRHWPDSARVCAGQRGRRCGSELRVGVRAASAVPSPWHPPTPTHTHLHPRRCRCRPLPPPPPLSLYLPHGDVDVGPDQAHAHLHQHEKCTRTRSVTSHQAVTARPMLLILRTAVMRK
jgi:hypothetical protein